VATLFRLMERESKVRLGMLSLTPATSQISCPTAARSPIQQGNPDLSEVRLYYSAHCTRSIVAPAEPCPPPTAFTVGSRCLRGLDLADAITERHFALISNHDHGQIASRQVSKYIDVVCSTWCTCQRNRSRTAKNGVHCEAVRQLSESAY